MPNTVVFQDKQTGYYCFHRPWDNGRGSLNSSAYNLAAMIESMESARRYFKEPFDPESAKPKIDYGNLDPEQLAPVSDTEIAIVKLVLAGARIR